jgi:hypothetical protein
MVVRSRIVPSQLTSPPPRSESSALKNKLAHFQERCRLAVIIMYLRIWTVIAYDLAVFSHMFCAQKRNKKFRNLRLGSAIFMRKCVTAVNTIRGKNVKVLIWSNFFFSCMKLNYVKVFVVVLNVLWFI